MKADGADVVKLFATASIRDGGKMTMTPEQIQAACGEATKARAALAWCTRIPPTARAPPSRRAARRSSTARFSTTRRSS